METKVNYVLVGAFVLVLSTALIAGILWLASGGGFQKQYDLYLALFDESVAGLNLNASIKYNGVDVGRVQDISLDPNNPEVVRLTFAIEHGTPIRQDTEAMLKTQGLTGIAYIELDSGPRDSPLLQAAASGKLPVIRTKPSLSARLETVLVKVLAKLDTTSDSVNKVLSEENIAALKSTLADLSVMTHTLAKRKDSIDAGITDAARTLDNSARITAQLGPLLDKLDRSAEAVRKMADETARTSVSAAKAIDSVGADAKRFTADTLPELQGLIGEMNVLTASLRRFVQETNHNPRGFLFGRNPGPLGPGESAGGSEK